MHYKRLQRHGHADFKITDGSQGCKVESCTKPHRTKGYCHSHYLTVDPKMRAYSREYNRQERLYFNRLKEAVLGKELSVADTERSFKSVLRRELK